MVSLKMVVGLAMNPWGSASSRKCVHSAPTATAAGVMESSMGDSRIHTVIKQDTVIWVVVVIAGGIGSSSVARETRLSTFVAENGTSLYKRYNSVNEERCPRLGMGMFANDKVSAVKRFTVIKHNSAQPLSQFRTD